VIEDDTSIAVFLSGSLLNHLHQDLLAQILVVSLANFRLFLTLGRRFLLSLLFLLLFFKSYLQFFLSLVKVLLSLVSDWKSTFDTVIIETIKFNNLSLMLLLKEVGNRCLPGLLGSNQY
jgi:hypothetical protein